MKLRRIVRKRYGFYIGDFGGRDFDAADFGALIEGGYIAIGG